MVVVNGKDFDFAGKSVSLMLSTLDVDCQKVVVELNQNILGQDVYDNYILCDGDTVEVVRFVGGG